MSSGAFRKKKTSFAQVSNSALRDETLSLKAKGLLALIESYLSLDNFTLYKQFLINKSSDGETAFRSAWKELKDKGYLIQYRLKNEETKQFYYEYEVCDNPYVEKPYVENPHVANATPSPCDEFPHVENPHVANLLDRIPTVQKNHSHNNSIVNNTIDNNTVIINNIRTNIDYYQVFVGSPDKDIVDNIVDVMADIMINNYESIKINRGEIKGIYLRNLFSKVNMHHIIYTVNAINSCKDKIHNMRNFIISVLYNSIQTLDSYYQNLVNT